MPIVAANGIRLHYERTGNGEPVVMIQGVGARGTAWHLHQVPALTAVGLSVITFDNRGMVPSSECPEGFTLQDMVGDVAGLIEHLDLANCRIVGTSLGAVVAQELALARPELVGQVVLISTHGRSDRLRAELARGELALHDSDILLPRRYTAALRALKSLSPRTLNDDTALGDWLDLFELAPQPGPGQRAQMAASRLDNRLAAYQDIQVPCLVIAFADDLITPPHMGREVADAISGAEYELIEGCGHYGYLEDPAAVNKAIVEFFLQGVS